jgi:hypothetical protein
MCIQTDTLTHRHAHEFMQKYMNTHKSKETPQVHRDTYGHMHSQTHMGTSTSKHMCTHKHRWKTGNHRHVHEHACVQLHVSITHSYTPTHGHISIDMAQIYTHTHTPWSPVPLEDTPAQCCLQRFLLMALLVLCLCMDVLPQPS